MIASLPHGIARLRNIVIRLCLGVLSFCLGTPLCLGTQAFAQTQLLYLTEDVPVSLDPDGPSSTVNTSQVGRINLLEPLIGYATKGTNDDGIRIPDFTKFEGRLAESWEYDPEAVTWTSHLRHGVIGCSGNEFTAEDVLYTLARAKSVSGATTIAWFSGSVAGIKGFTADVFKGGDKDLGDAVTAVDPYTVRIKQGSPNAFFLVALSLHPIYMFDSRAMKAHSTPTDPWSHDYANTQNVDGYGPYCQERWVKGDEFVVHANEHYYRGKPPIDRIVMKKVPQSSNRLVTLRSGQAGLIQGLTPSEYASLRGARGVTVGGVYGNETLFISPNLKSPVWDNKLVRQAMAYAIDYNQILQTGYVGQARKWDGLIPTSFPGSTRTLAQYTYDPDKAKQLLAQAGFPSGAGLEKFPDELKLTYASEREATLGPIATVLQSSLRAVGFPIVLDPVSQSQMASRRIVKRDLPLALSDIDKAVAVDSVYSVNLFFLTKELGGIVNTNNYSNPDLDKLVLEARASLSADERTADAAKLQDMMAADLPWVPIAETRTQWAYSSKLHGMTWYPDNSVRWFDLSLEK
jgi:peptide/nickel transport system substrate-binding protein